MIKRINSSLDNNSAFEELKLVVGSYAKGNGKWQPVIAKEIATEEPH